MCQSRGEVLEPGQQQQWQQQRTTGGLTSGHSVKDVCRCSSQSHAKVQRLPVLALVVQQSPCCNRLFSFS